MKKLLLLISIIGVGLTSSAQNSGKSEKIVVSVDDLTPEQLENARTKNKVEQVTKQLETYGKYAGIGKEVGIAVSEGLGAVKDVTLEFADSKVGKLTMALIIWKVIGDDIKGIVFGIPLWLLGIGLILWSYRRTSMYRNLEVSREGGWWIFGGKREYKNTIPMYYDGAGGAVHMLIALIYTSIMFGGVIF